MTFDFVFRWCRFMKTIGWKTELSPIHSALDKLFVSVQYGDVNRAEKVFVHIKQKTIYMYGAMFKG